MTIEERDQLLKEYELCQDKAKHLDKNIWATSGLMGLGSIGSIFLSDHNENPLTITIIGLLIIATVWIWWRMANRWWDIQHA